MSIQDEDEDEAEAIMLAAEELVAMLEENAEADADADDDAEADADDASDTDEEAAAAPEEADTDGEQEEDNDEETNAVYYPEFLPPEVLAIDDPRRMQITANEHQMALNIRQAVADNPDIDMVSDFMCAHLALVDGVNIEEALDRLFKIQCFREEYEIQDTVERGVKIFAEYIDLMPALHLCFTYNHEKGNYVIVFDNKNFNASGIKSEKDIKAWMGGSYYTAVMLCPDLEAIRRGGILIAECEGYDWKQNMGCAKNMRRVWSEIGSVYPCTWEKFKYFNSGVSMNMALALLKPILPKGIQKKLEFGCQFDARLDTLYLVPNLEAANDRLLRRVEESLRRRYLTEQTFQL